MLVSVPAEMQLALGSHHPTSCAKAVINGTWIFNVKKTTGDRVDEEGDIPRLSSTLSPHLPVTPRPTNTR